MRILSIDSGNEKSALLIYDSETKQILYKVICANWECERIILFNKYLQETKGCHCAIEMPECFGMAVGKEVLHTCRMVGRFELLAEQMGLKTSLIYRHEVKMHLCHKTTAKDGNIRQALIDLYGGKNIAIGNKKCPKCKGKGWFGLGRPTCPVCKGNKWKYPPGLLCDIVEDLWSALAIAVTYAETKNRG